MFKNDKINFEIVIFKVKNIFRIWLKWKAIWPFIELKYELKSGKSGQSAPISEVASKEFSRAKKRRKTQVSERQETEAEEEPEPEFRNVPDQDEEISPDHSDELDIDEESLFN